MENPTRIPRHDTLFQPSLEARELAEYFRSMAIGDIVTYAELSVMANHKDVQGASRHILNTARKIAQQDNVVMGTVRGEGLKRLSDVEVVQSGESDRRGMRKRAHNAVTRLNCVNARELNDADRAKAYSYMGLFASVALVANFQTIRTIKRMVEHENIEPLDPKDVLKLFVSDTPRRDSTRPDTP